MIRSRRRRVQEYEAALVGMPTQADVISRYEWHSSPNYTKVSVLEFWCYAKSPERNIRQKTRTSRCKTSLVHTDCGIRGCNTSQKPIWGVGRATPKTTVASNNGFGVARPTSEIGYAHATPLWNWDCGYVNFYLCRPETYHFYLCRPETKASQCKSQFLSLPLIRTLLL